MRSNVNPITKVAKFNDGIPPGTFGVLNPAIMIATTPRNTSAIILMWNRLFPIDTTKLC